MIARFALLASVALLAACGPAARRATTPRPMPAETVDRRAAMDELGRRLHAALAAGRPEDVLFGDDELRAVATSESATRIAAHRASLSVRIGAVPQVAQRLAPTVYVGVCLQDAREDDGALGLRSPGWTFRRVLLAARQPGGRRTGLWVDGLFVFTDDGFRALDLERIEDPRWEHSDLDLAPCDMATDLR